MEQLLLNNLYGVLCTAILCVDAEDRIRYFNAFAASELETPPEQVIGKSFQEVFVREENSFFEGRIWRFLPSGKRFEFDRALDPDERKVPVLSRLLLPECRNWGVMCFSAVIGETRILEHAPGDFGLVLLEEKQVLRIFGNRSWEELFGEEVSGLESFRVPGGVVADSPVILTLQDGRVHQTRQNIGGRKYQVASYPVVKQDRLTGVLVSYFDQTNINEVQSRLMLAMRSAEDANRAKSFFLANMSHELRTPLNAVIGYCELLQEGGLSGREAEESLAGINFAGNALLRLINNILDLSKIEAGQITFLPKPTDISAMLQELKTLFQHSCWKNNIEQQLDIQPQLPVLMVDELRLRQVLLNLIGNACKFTHDGLVRVGVRYTPGDGDRGTLAIAVIDTGCGIAEEKQEAIFKPFTQENAMTHPHIFKGTGLGLAIARQMVQCMKGRIELSSELGKGSVFTVILEDVPAVSPAAAETGVETGEAQLKEYMAGLEALLVDDVPINLKILSAMCTSFGVKNRTAGSGEEALRMIREAVPDVVMTDMWMPEMSGVELLEEIRKDDALREMPVVIVTADVEARDKGVLEKFDAEVFKPISKEKLRGLFVGLYNRKAERS